jgi:CBS domain-containing protein
MNYAERERRLTAIHEALAAAQPVESLTVREFISWFNAERRGYKVTYRIRRYLKDHGIRTVPDFDGVHIDARIAFAQAEPEVEAQPEQQAVEVPPAATEVSHMLNVVPSEPAALVAGAAAEPAFRVSRLLAASTKPLSVPPDCTLCEAVTLMLRHDYSQLPVMTNERDVKGVVSWESIAPRLALAADKSEFVRDYIKGHHEVNSTDSLFRVIGRIVEHSYVLVRAQDRTISGIVTTTDLSLQFQQLSEPFLLLAEIENHVRKLIDGRFTVDELSSVKDQADPERVIETVADLTFGEYIRLLENPDHWAKTGLRVDRKVFVKELDKVRLIRNDVMHFDPDGITNEDHSLLRHFVQFLHDVRRIAASG